MPGPVALRPCPGPARLYEIVLKWCGQHENARGCRQQADVMGAASVAAEQGRKQRLYMQPLRARFSPRRAKRRD